MHRIRAAAEWSLEDSSGVRLPVVDADKASTGYTLQHEGDQASAEEPVFDRGSCELLSICWLCWKCAVGHVVLRGQNATLEKPHEASSGCMPAQGMITML